jgi:uncharacterized protein (DUF58 family)
MRYRAAATDRQARITRALRSAGAGQLTLSTERDWVGDVVRYVTRHRWLRVVPALEAQR